MSTKIINGTTITAGYVLSPSYSALSLTKTAAILGVEGAAGGKYGYGAAGSVALLVTHTASVANSGGIVGGQGGDGGPGGSTNPHPHGDLGGVGGAGVNLSGGLITFTNRGTVTGGAGGHGGNGGESSYGGAGGAGGAGVILAAAASSEIQNTTGLIQGGVGGAGGVTTQLPKTYPATKNGLGGAGGAGVVLAAGSQMLNNHGTVVGGVGGVGASVPFSSINLGIDGGVGGAGGAGVNLVMGGSLSLTNFGVIAGGTGGAGGVGGANVTFSGSIAGGGGGAGGAAIAGDAGSVYFFTDISNAGSIQGGAGAAGGAAGAAPGGFVGDGGDGGDGIFLPSGAVALTNSGAIIGGAGGKGGFGGVGGVGVDVSNAGGIDNTGLIAGGAGGESASGGWGGTAIRFGPGGSVTNSGSIIGGQIGVIDVAPAGVYPAETGYGIVFASGGVVTNGSANATTALIQGVTGISSSGPTTVTNFGAIEGIYAGGFHSSVGYGLDLRGGGRVNNTGTAALIEGSNTGVYLGYSGSAGSLTNDGAIEGGDDALILFSANDFVENGEKTDVTASLVGETGIYAGTNTFLSLSNFGTIEGKAGAGVFLGKDGVLTNGFSGSHAALIEGSSVGIYGYHKATVVNFGTIKGAVASVHFASASDRLTVEVGSVLSGVAVGGGGTLEMAKGTGTISGLGNAFIGFGVYEIDSGGSWTLSGTNALAGQKITVTGTLVDAGTLSGFGTIGASGTVSVTAGGTINASSATALFVQNHAVSNGGLMEATGKGGLSLVSTVVSGGGTILAATASRVLIKGATIEGGNLKTAGTGLFETGAGANVLDGTAAKVTNSGSIKVMGGTGLTLQGTIDGAGTITLVTSTAAAVLTIGSVGATLTGGGQINMGNKADDAIIGAGATATLTNAGDKIVGAGLLGGAQMTLVNDKGATINGKGSVGLTIDTGANTITNAGVLEADQTTVTVKSAVTNSGTLLAYLGTLTLVASASGTGVTRIQGGTVIAEGAVFSQAVTFASGTTGTLELAHSQAYKNRISGFSKTGATTLDLDDIAFIDTTHTTAKFQENKYGTSGVLTVTDGTHTAKITLGGNFSGSTFTTSSDGHGGVKVVDPPEANPSAALFASQAAAMSSSGGSTSLATQPEAKPLTPFLAASG